MCGVFGFVSDGKKELNLQRLQRIARVTERRGSHAFGFAWIDSFGHLHCFKQTGPISNSLSILAMAADARMLIGHCRYATQGSHYQNLNNHPHAADGGWIVHNGMLPDYRRVIDDYQLLPVTDCDSEILGLLLEHFDGRLSQRCAKTVEASCDDDQPLVMLGLWNRPARMAIVKRGNPLHFGRAKEGVYIGSLPDEIPEAKSVRKNSVHVFKGSKCFYYSLNALVG